MMPVQTITGGLLDGQSDPAGHLETLISEMQRAGINAVLSDKIEQLMWDKWAFLATLAAANCLTRGSIAEIHATDHGERLILDLYEECNRTATAEGYPPNPAPVQDYHGTLTDTSLPMTASMLRDMEGGGPTEADHILGGMIGYAAKHGIDTPYLNAAYTALQVYEAKRTG
jgi:2-dehydropantoate 2-reductase